MPTYKEAGVDVGIGNEFVAILQKKFPYIGGFSGLYPINDNQSLVASTDGVGTKLKLAFELNEHSTVGIDLVAMCVNDIITTGAKPLFFLDYFACNKLDLNIAKEVLGGISRGCEKAGCMLLGGETAEMPGFYKNKEYDLAGFCVGIVQNKLVVNGSFVEKKDVIVGLRSSGVHSNGFSLIRKIIQDTKVSLEDPLDKDSLGKCLLSPTKIYVDEVAKTLSKYQIKAMAHITGGGLEGNIKRVIPKEYHIKLDYNWDIPQIFHWIQKKGRIDSKEMSKVFNMGIGYVFVVSPEVFNAMQSDSDISYIKIGNVC